MAVRSGIRAVLALGLALACAPTGAAAAVIFVNPGESIQAAVDAALEGDIIKVLPGEYIETHGGSAAVLITKRLKLVAKNTDTENVVIKPGPGNTDGILVQGTPGTPVERVLVKGFTVEGFPNNGIWLQYAHNFTIKNNVSANNLENGIWPTLSTRGRVKNNVAYGSLDSGLWVEASENIRVFKNELYNNPTGLEITVSRNVIAKGNDIHDNTVGVGLYHPNAAGLPPLGDDGKWIIKSNNIYDNNFPNPAPPGGLVAQLPPGVGVLVIGVDRVTLEKNTVTNNDLFGIAMADWCLFVDCVADPPVVEDKADQNSFTLNTVTGNGTNPDPGLPPLITFFAGDMAFVSDGVDNCQSLNTYGTLTGPPFFPAPGPC